MPLPSSGNDQCTNQSLNCSQCSKCFMTIHSHQLSLQCDTCLLFFHIECTKYTRQKLENFKGELKFSCENCSKCSICCKVVAVNHKAIQCDSCNMWAHIKCNFLSDKDYDRYKNDSKLNFYCLKCNAELVPFSSMDDTHFKAFAKTGAIISDHSDMQLMPSPEQQAMLQKISEKLIFYAQDRGLDELDEESISNCSYFSSDEFKTAKFSTSETFSIFHLNIHSIERHIEEMRLLLQVLEFNFDILCFSETKIIDGIGPKVDINIPGYQDPIGMDTQATKGGVLIYVKEGINYIPRPDLDIEADKQLESCFIEIINSNKPNHIIGVLYRHPIMDQAEFIHYYLQNLVGKLAKENKPVYLSGDWNFNLLQLSNHKETLDFFETMMSNLFAPSILLPTRVTTTSATLIDNIFTNDIQSDRRSGNLTVSISDHYPSFYIIPIDPVTNKTSQKAKFKRDRKNFSKENFLLDFLAIDWDGILNIENNDVNYSTKNFIDKMTSLIDKHMPLVEITPKENKQLQKPWISEDILNKINRKNKLYKEFQRTKSIEKQSQFNRLKNDITSQIRKNKKEHYEQYFKEHKMNLKKVWNGIKEIINIKPKSSKQTHHIMSKDKLVTDEK